MAGVYMKIFIIKVYVYMFEKILYYDNSKSYIIMNDFNIDCFNGYKEFYCKEGLIWKELKMILMLMVNFM